MKNIVSGLVRLAEVGERVLGIREKHHMGGLDIWTVCVGGWVGMGGCWEAWASGMRVKGDELGKSYRRRFYTFPHATMRQLG